jgi:hypothetical protein
MSETEKQEKEKKNDYVFGHMYEGIIDRLDSDAYTQ